MFKHWKFEGLRGKTFYYGQRTCVEGRVGPTPHHAHGRMLIWEANLARKHLHMWHLYWPQVRYMKLKTTSFSMRGALETSKHFQTPSGEHLQESCLGKRGLFLLHGSAHTQKEVCDMGWMIRAAKRPTCSKQRTFFKTTSPGFDLWEHSTPDPERYTIV